jgi:hypothetical protein
MSRKPIGEKAMTATERQRRRRARLQGEGPPKQRGRPKLKYLEPGKLPEGWTAEARLEFLEALGGCKRESTRRGDAARRYANFGEQALRIDPRCEDYSPENAEKYRSLKHKKGILEQLGRLVIFEMLELGNTLEEATSVVREWADDLLIDGDSLDIKESVRFFQWLRKDMRDQVPGRGEWANDDA